MKLALQIVLAYLMLFLFLHRALRATEENLEPQDLRSVRYLLFLMYQNMSANTTSIYSLPAFLVKNL